MVECVGSSSSANGHRNSFGIRFLLSIRMGVLRMGITLQGTPYFPACDESDAYLIQMHGSLVGDSSSNRENVLLFLIVSEAEAGVHATNPRTGMCGERKIATNTNK